METRRTPPDPRFGAPIELPGGECRGSLNLGVIGEALASKGIPPEESPPPLYKIEPARADGKWLLMQAGMLPQPLPNRPAGVTGEIVVDQVEVAGGICGIDCLQELEKAGSIAGGSGEGECLPISGSQGTVDPDLVRSTAIVQRGFNAVPIRRPDRSRGEDAGP